MAHARPRSLAAYTMAWLLALGLLAAADEPTASPAPLCVGQLRVGKILFLGNSITLHGPAQDIGWSGNWGMAASAAEKDYVHLLIARLKDAAGGQPQVMVKNVADFEREFATYDVAAGLRDAIDFQADVIVIAIGENVPSLTTSEIQRDYQPLSWSCSIRCGNTAAAGDSCAEHVLDGADPQRTHGGRLPTDR